MVLIKRFNRSIQIILLLLAVYGTYPLFTFVKRVTGIGAIPPALTVGDKNAVPVVIIGSGPAGLMAAKTILDEGIPVIILEGKQPGGPLNAWTPVGNWATPGVTSGKIIIADMRAQVEAFKNARFIARSVTSVNFSDSTQILELDNGERLNSKAVIIAMGTRAKRIIVPGTEKYASAISYEQRPPQSQYSGHCLVVGGGVDAMRKAFYRVKKGATVTLATRGHQLHGAPERKEELDKLVKKGKLTILYGVELRELSGENGTLKAAHLSDGTTLRVDQVAVGIGRVPNTELFSSQLKLAFDKSIIVQGHTQATSQPGVFAAGDITGGNYDEALIAAGDGMKAGKDVVKYLGAQSMRPNT